MKRSSVGELDKKDGGKTGGFILQPSDDTESVTSGVGLVESESLVTQSKRTATDDLMFQGLLRTHTVSNKYEIFNSIDINKVSYIHLFNMMQLRRDISSVAAEEVTVRAIFFVEDKSGNKLLMFDSEDPYPNGPIERSIFEEL